MYFIPDDMLNDVKNIDRVVNIINKYFNRDNDLVMNGSDDYSARYNKAYAELKEINETQILEVLGITE